MVVFMILSFCTEGQVGGPGDLLVMHKVCASWSLSTFVRKYFRQAVQLDEQYFFRKEVLALVGS